MTPNERVELTMLGDLLVATTDRELVRNVASSLSRLCREIAIRVKTAQRGDWMGQALRFESMVRPEQARGVSHVWSTF